MNIDEIIKKIESTYEVESIFYKNIPLWPFLRYEIFSIWFDKISNNDNNSFNSVSKVSFNSKVKKTFSSFFKTDLHLLFKKQSQIYFVNDSGVREINGKNDDRICGLLIKKNPIVPIVPNDIPDKNYPFDKYISEYFLNKISKIIPYCFKRKDIINYELLDKILNELMISVDIKPLIKSIIKNIKFYTLWFKIIKPQCIYVTCYYVFNRLPAFYVAKKMGIPVIEFQHGMIGSNHIAYNSYKKIIPNPYPNKIMIFGEKYKEYISNNIYEENNIIVNGYYYIDNVKKQKDFNKNVFNKKYHDIGNKKVITVASQLTVDKELFYFSLDFAKKNENFHVIFIPRENENYHNNNNVLNFTIESNLDVYQCIQNSDICITVYSTCCFEALALGVPCVLLDINNLATLFMSEYIDPKSSLVICKDFDKLVSYINKQVQLSREVIMTEGRLYYEDNHNILLEKNLKIEGNNEFKVV